MVNEHLTVLGRILNKYAPLGPSEVGVVMDCGELQELGKQEVVFAEKRFNGHEYFQLRGISHRYSTDGDGQQLTTGIFQGECVITPNFTRTRNGQSIFSLQALTDSLFLRVPAGTFRELMDRLPTIRSFGNSVVGPEFSRGLQYEVIFRSYTARDRLLYFRDNYPGLENEIPHTVIASFLGITPVSFSRLRSEMTKG